MLKVYNVNLKYDYIIKTIITIKRINLSFAPVPNLHVSFKQSPFGIFSDSPPCGTTDVPFIIDSF